MALKLDHILHDIKANQTNQRLKFREQMRLEREKLVIQTVNELLSTRGFDAMTVDEVADQVGIAKASLYRHFSGKEALAVAALLSVMKDVLELAEAIDGSVDTALEKLQLVIMWALQKKAEHQMPNLPSTNSVLRDQLLANREYINGLVKLSDRLGGWIESAQQEGVLSQTFPSIVILYGLYARACDPVLDFLLSSGAFTREEAIGWVMKSFFEGALSR